MYMGDLNVHEKVICLVFYVFSDNIFSNKVNECTV